jgi:DNA helicase-2/ATP-dependent DNA helicase PcrA
MKHLEQLNEEQKEAVLHKRGPLLIVAGAGAGKTKTITHRILNLIKNGTEPKKILAVTFTNKAAKEMQERIVKLIEEDPTLNIPISFSERPNISTFHSLGVQILRENHTLFDLKKHFSILGQNDSLSLIKEALKKLDIDPKQFEPKRISSVISRQKGDLIDVKSYSENAGNEYFPRIVASIWEEYEKLLKKNGGLDFDDLILKTVQLLENNKEVREHYQKKWQFVHIDEYQDTNTSQYRLSQLLAGPNKNICVVGDMDQCLPGNTKISTKNGDVKISKIKKGDEVVSAAGSGHTCLSKVEKVISRKYKGNLIEIKTKSGEKLSMTPNHILFSNFPLNNLVFYTYLMYKKNMGYRVGIVQGTRKSTKEKSSIGFITRSNQEKADKMWVLKISKKREDAQYWEYFFSFKYGIPTVVFHISGRKMTLGQDLINKLYKSIPTQNNVNQLFIDTGISKLYPHYLPQGTTRGNTDKDRTNVRLTMFSDKRRSALCPWGLSRVSINTTSITLKNKLTRCGFKTRKGKNKDWRLEISRLNYKEAEEIANKIIKIDDKITIVKTALLTSGKRFMFQSAGNLHAGMNIAYLRNNKICEDEIVEIKERKHDGDIYDINIEKTHNYIAEGVAVHNSVYSWRGADFRNILKFEKDYPEAKVVLLEENYRSTANILTAANDIIKKNKERKEKKLFTKKEGGEKIGLFESYDENEEASFVAKKSSELIKNGTPPKNIAVLYRANFQSRAIEEAFLSQDIPYQVLGVKFFERREVKDILSFLRASLNPDNMADIKRIINVPPRGIGKVTLLKIFASQEQNLPQKMQEKVANFRDILNQIGNKAINEKISDTIKFIMKITGIESTLKKGTDEDKERLENIMELVTLATKYDILPPEEAVIKLLEDASLASDQDSLHVKKEAENNAVRLMTVHASKGLEFPYVFITGLEDGLFPHSGFGESSKNSERQEEERRLFYVALTRAEKKAYLSYTSVRTVFGMKQVNMPSEFITDIDDELIENESIEENTINFD